MKNIYTYFLALSLCAAMLSACGFRPMYVTAPAGTQKAALAESKFQSIAIAIIPDQEGQVLRNNLIDRLYHNGYPNAPEYTLNISTIQETRTELDLTKSSDATRAQLRLQTTMALSDKAGKEILTRPLQTVTSFNILGSEFATRVTEQAARESAINDIARQVELHLSLYFNAQ